MASTKSLAISSAAAASTSRLMPMTPPKAETGSAARARLVGFEDGGAGGGAAGVGVLDDGDGGVVASNSLTSSQQASRSTRLL